MPARLRPSGWPSTRPLPIDDRRGDLNDPAERARIKADAERLHGLLVDARAGGQPRRDPDARTLETLIADWQGSGEWKDNKPRTNRGYEESIREIRFWVAQDNPDPVDINARDVEDFLSIYDDRPTTRYHVRKALRLVMKQAIKRKWRSDNPVNEVRAAMPKSRVVIWEQADVDHYVWAALAAGNPDLAAIILMEWEIGQRITDLIAFRRGAEYLPAEGLFSFSQSKTAENVAIPVSGRLRAVLEHIRRDGSMFLFHDATSARSTAAEVLDLLASGNLSRVAMGQVLGISDVAVGKALRKLQVGGYVRIENGRPVVLRPVYQEVARPFADVSRLGHVFADVRDRFVLPSGGRHLVLRALRHSCVVQLARAGCTVPEIASITGHAPASVEEILRIYLPRDSTVAMNAQRKRGLIA